MDPIHPIAPGPPGIAPGSRPVERSERVSRERDRPARERQERARRRAASVSAPDPDGHDGADGEHPHVDVRV